jgi:hypothetical protein
MDREEEVRRLEQLAHWLDTRFGIPGTRLRFGLDSVLGLIPGVGDLATALPAIYLIHRAQRLGAPAHVLTRMVANLGIDLALGAVPVIGDLFDFGFKSNRRNLALLKRHLEREASPARASGPLIDL